MAKLACKTRENSSPEGKTRVYFTCNPNDFDAYFEPICEEILAAQDCAIYFKEDPASGWEGPTDMEEALGSMQLFVVPVTRRLFSGDDPSVARYYELPFAGEHNILLLGLIQEKEGNLDYIFNENYKNHILLDRFANSDDPERPPYEEALKMILSYFLSPIYMRQNEIRQMNEEYEEAYERLLRLADVFKEKNSWEAAKETYMNLVSVAEAWMAESNGSIDERILIEPYLGLGNADFSAGNLPEAEICTVKGLEIFDKFKDEEEAPRLHRARACACKNMGDICLAKNDSEGAVAWYMTGVNLSEELPKEVCTLEDRKNLTGLYTSLGDIFTERENFEPAFLYYNNALDLSVEICKETQNDPKSLRDLSVMYEKMGTLFSKMRRTDAAQAYYQESLKASLAVYSIVAESSAGSEAWVNATYDLSFGYYFLGLTCKDKGDLKAAAENFHSCLELRKEVYEISGNFKQEVYDCYTLLIKVLREAGHFEEAEKYNKEAMNL